MTDDLTSPPTIPIDEPVWRKGDPRHDINKRARIVILRPIAPGRFGAMMADVETKHGWSIVIDDRSQYGKSLDDWDPDWLWTWAPPFTV